ncbi:hypothetical protein ADK60_32260 [Streptomyces sp. XY431]|uniref:DUF6236 family protein n=1 Tax=Streptomyces sp. XY431 TaxID=1415562 RepID=UPI0006ADC6E9|nr:DUF6236 family protein [Streptomyces sp. XY431]KOV12371.1 hypothetical protein ADK60_32260 [Streptomyces sp. XY431]
MQQIGLYYPYVHVQDDAWMKTAALYWPQIARVVPDGYPVRDTDSARALAEQLDFFVPVSPGSAPAAVEAPFLEVIQEHAGVLRRYYQVDEWGRSLAVPPALRRTNAYVSQTLARTHSHHHDGRPPGHVAHLYWKEVSPNLREALIQEGLAINTDRPTYEGSNPLGTWISMDPMLAWVYKCALTDELARRNRLLPTTDQIAAHAANEEWTTEHIARVLLRGRPPQADQPVTAVLGELAVQMVLPTDMATVPVEKVIELRQKHATEFDAFMTKVDTVAGKIQEEIAGIENREVLAAYLGRVKRKEFEAPLRELRAAMKSLKLEATTGVINVQTQAPAVLGTAGGYVGGGLPYASAVGVAFGLFGYTRQISKQRQDALAGSPVSFLLRVEDGLRPGSLVRRLAQRIR